MIVPMAVGSSFQFVIARATDVAWIQISVASEPTVRNSRSCAKSCKPRVPVSTASTTHAPAHRAEYAKFAMLMLASTAIDKSDEGASERGKSAPHRCPSHRHGVQDAVKGPACDWHRTPWLWRV